MPAPVNRPRRLRSPLPPAPTAAEVCADFEPLRLVQARHLQGWSRRDLAEATGITASRIAAFESAIVAPKPWESTELAETLKCPHGFFRRGRPMAVLDSADLFMCTIDR